MKKLYIAILVVFVLFISTVLIFVMLGRTYETGNVVDAVDEVSQPPVVTTTAPPPEITTVRRMTASMENTLFIGDSRTVGLSEYASLPGATFFARVGMTVFEIDKTALNVSGVGYVTLDDILQRKTYDKIYVMLGVNEIGYDMESIVSKYVKILEKIIAYQPEAFIIMQANLHVTSSYYYTNGIINNPAIDQLNSILVQYADNQRLFFLDANPVFDDGTGNLAVSNSSDGIHLHGYCYARWGEWIKEQTAQLNVV